MNEINFSEYDNGQLVTLLLELAYDAEEGWGESFDFANANLDKVREEVINRMK